MFRLLLTGILLSTVGLRCSAAEATGQSNRYLLVLETSREMGRRTNALRDSLEELLQSGFNHQIRAGDTLGIWAFNEQLFTGHLSLQAWPGTNASALVSRLLKVVGSHRFQGASKPAVLMPELMGLIQESEFITVIIATTGESDFEGLPSEISQYFENWRSAQRRNRGPFLVLLRGEKGRLATFTVTAHPWALDIPPVPPERLAPKPTSSLAKTNLPAKTLAPLILSGRKTNEEVAQPLISTNVAAAPATNLVMEKPEPIVTHLPPAPKPTPLQLPASGTASAEATLKVLPRPATNTLSAQMETNVPTVAPAPPPIPIPPEPPSSQTEIESPASPKRLLIAGAAGLAIIVLIGAGWIGMRPRRTEKASLITESLEKRK